jgi:uncharacterized repeat protein (TIGR01451 family)
MSGAEHPAGSRRAILLGLSVVTALIVGQAGMLMALARPPVDSPGPPSADGVQPVVVDTQSSSDDCGLLGFAYGISMAGDGQVSSGDLTVTVTGYNSPTGFADWSATVPIHGVYVKGGSSGGNFLNYPAGDTRDRDLHTPRKATGGYYGLSHLSFCWNDAPLAPDVTVDEGFCGAIVNVADVSASNESGEASGNNVSNEVMNTVGCQGPTPPDLQVSKSSNADGTLHEGDDFLYTITVTNVGDEEATGVHLVDVLPPGALNVAIPPFPTFAGDACTITSSVPEPGGVPHGEVRCGPVTLGPGASASVTIKVIVDGDVCGQITNVVDVEGANEPAANVGADNHAEATDEIACVPRIRLQKGGPSHANVGDTITYVFAVTNTGGVDLSKIDLSDPKCDVASPTLIDDADGDDRLAVDEEWSFACEHTINAGDGDPVHNEASVSGDHGGGTVTDTDTHDVGVLHPGIDLEKTASPTSGPSGTLIVYTYAVTNSGDTPLFDVSVDDDKVGHVGTIATLAVDGTVQLGSEITLGSSPITNNATAGGSDALGAFVSDEDSAKVTVVSGGEGGNGTGSGSPFTGSDPGALAAWIVVFAALGSSLLATSRRPSDSRG